MSNSIKSAIAVIFVAVFIAGCSLFDTLDDKGASLTFRVTGEMAAKIAGEARSARSADDGGSDTDGLFFDIALKGGYSASKTLPVTDVATATFDNIPVGTELWAEGSAYRIEEIDGNQTKIVLYTGKSDRVTIKDGENTLSLVMKKAESDEPVTPADETEDVSVKIYISAAGTDENDGTAAHPLATVAGAVAKINALGQGDVGYTIYIDGEISGAQKIAAATEGGTLSDIAAASITLEGKTGSGTDKINAGWDGDTDNLPDSENNIGTALSIKTSVPVTIKNLTVTGGCAASGYEDDDLGGGIRLGGVYSDGDTEKPFEASLTLAGGAVVTKNYANGYGGGVYVSFGSNLTIKEGAEISGNTGYGGGVCIYPCGTESVEGTFKTTVTMNGGSISGNTGYANTNASFGGGRVLVYDYSGSASFVMNGGSISENTCDGYGGGVCIYGENVKFTMNGGTIGGSSSDNGNSSTTYNGYGGGVYINRGATFEMTDGAISYNKSESTGYGGGGAVFISSGTFDMKGGSLTSNTATYRGGGVYIASAGIFNMTGGSISGNTATNDGNGVYQYNYNGSTGTFSMGGSAVVAEDNDVYLASGTKVTIADALTGTPPVATITPEEYTAGTTLLEVAADSGTTLAAEYAKFAVSDSDFWNITTEGKLKKIFFGTKKPTEEKAVYDIVFSDGSATPYTEGLTLSNDEKNAAIAVIFYKGTGLNSPDSEGNADTERTLGLGLAQKNRVYWSGDPNSNSNNYGNAWNVRVTATDCTPTNFSGNRTGIYEFGDSADKNGSDNLSQIAEALTAKNLEDTTITDDTSSPTKYTAFYFAINYKEEEESHVSGTDYENNWYLPTAAELYELGKVYTSINSAITCCGGTALMVSNGDDYYDYISSSQYSEDTNRILTIRFEDPLYIGYEYKYDLSDSIYACAIREF